MKKLFIILALLVSGCLTDEDSSRSTLRKQGFTDVEITGYAWMMCGEDDFYKTAFRAKNVNGEVVEGAVCCGQWSKGCTVRF